MMLYMSEAKTENTEIANSPTSVMSLIISGARTFGIGTIVAAFLLYEHFYVILPSHEENMRKQIEQCTNAVTAISEELKKVNITIERVLFLLDSKPKDLFHVPNASR